MNFVIAVVKTCIYKDLEIVGAFYILKKNNTQSDAGNSKSLLVLRISVDWIV